MKKNLLIPAAIAIAAAILVLLIVVKLYSGREVHDPDYGKGSVKTPAKESAAQKNTPAGTRIQPKDDKDIRIQRLVDELGSQNAKKIVFPQAEGIIRELCDFGNDAIPAIKKLLASDASPAIKSLAARALAQIGTSESVEVLVNAIGSESDPACKDLFIRTLQAVDKAEASPALIKGLETSKDVFFTAEAKEAIARSGNEETVKQLAEACRGQTQMTPQLSNLLGALSTIRQPDTIPSLSALAAGEQNLQLRKSALRALSSMGYPESTQALVDMYKAEKNPDGRMLLLDAIAGIRSKDSLEMLRSISGNAAYSEDLRKNAARAVFTIINGVPPAE